MLNGSLVFANSNIENISDVENVVKEETDTINIETISATKTDTVISDIDKIIEDLSLLDEEGGGAISGGGMNMQVNATNSVGISINTNYVMFIKDEISFEEKEEEEEVKNPITITVTSSLTYDIKSYILVEYSDNELTEDTIQVKSDEYGYIGLNKYNKPSITTNEQPTKSRYHFIELKWDGSVYSIPDIYHGWVVIEISQK
jgi:hypothetical protein